MLSFGHVADVWTTYASTHLGYCVRHLPFSLLALSLSVVFCVRSVLECLRVFASLLILVPVLRTLRLFVSSSVRITRSSSFLVFSFVVHIVSSLPRT